MRTKDSLSKYLAQSGVASRRKVIDLIKQGLIKVNGIIINEPGYKLQSDDAVTYRDKPVHGEQKIYILLNKPKNYITTVSDEKGRKTVMDIIKDAIGQRVYPVGRLDRDTTGLLLLTNDGDFAQKLAHPRYEIEKIYIATLDRVCTQEDLATIKKGLQLKDGFIKVDAAGYIADQLHNQVKVILHSGKNRIVRRIFEHLDYQVKKLDRVGYAGLTKKDLKIGDWRYLTDSEVKRLMR